MALHPAAPVAPDPTTLFVVVFGVRIAIRLDDPSILGRITVCLPPQWCLCSPSKIDRVYRLARTENGLSWALFGDDILLGRTVNLDALCGRFQYDLERFVAAHARTHAIVRAGVVGWEGRAIVVPGARVSSLVAGLIELGAEYYSDEYALIDVRGRVWPFPRPLSSERSLGDRERLYLETSGAVGRGPLPIGWIVVANDRVHEPQCIGELTRNHAVLALSSNAAAAQTQPAFLLQTLRTAVRDAIVLPAPRVDPTAAAYHLLAQCVSTWSESLIPHR
jgi:hypothetical protein